MGFLDKLFGRRSQRPDPQQLLEMLFAFIQADTWAESRRIVEEHPELLTGEADALLAQLLQAADEQDDDDARRVFEKHRALLRRCREVGVEEAFAPLTPRPAEQREAGGEGLPAALLAFIQADTWAESRRIVEEHPELLTGEADALLAQLLQAADEQDDDDARRVFEKHRALLRRCREVGVEEAFAPLTPRPAEQREAGGEGNLRAILQELSQPARLRDMPRRVKLCRQALAQIPRQMQPELWAALQNELANSLAQNPLGERAENLEQAIAHYRQALEVRTRQDFPEQWAMTQNNLATAYSDRIRGERAENLEQAIAHYRQALEVRTRQTMPADHRQTQRNLGNLLFKLGRWPETVEAYHGALEAGELLYQAAATPEARRAELGEAQDIPARLAYALAQTGESVEAVVALEQNRARWLAEALALQSERPPNVPDAVWEAFVARRQDVQTLQAEANLPEGTPGRRDYLALSPLLAEARQALAEAIERVRAHAPDFMPEVTFTGIQAAAQDAPLVYLLAAPAGGLALVVHAGGVEAVPLPALTETALRERLYGPADNPEPGGYLGAYFHWRANPSDEAGQQTWFDALDETTRWLWEAAMGPVVEALALLPPPGREKGARGRDESRPVVLIPTGLLGLLPLHAAWTADETTPTQRRYALDELLITYAPSARGLQTARELAAAIPPRRLLQVVEPLPTSAARLPAAHVEARAVYDCWPEEAYTSRGGVRATIENVRQLLAEADVFHFNGHAVAGWDTPLAGGLLLSGDRMLTVANWQEQQVHLRLATLSACETGVPGLKLPDEVVSLPAALMQAGCAGVVASLWSVGDRSTARLMGHFYRLWRQEELSPAAALRLAQRTLRDQNGAAHPFYWGAFTLTGV